MIPLVVASERGRAQTMMCHGIIGVVGPRCGTKLSERNVLERSAIDGDSPVFEASLKPSGILSSAGHEEFCVNLPGPSGKAKYSRETDSEPVP